MPRSPSFTWLHHLRTRSSVALVPWCLALILVAINPPLPLDMKPMNRDSGACQRLYSALENSNFGGSHLKRLKSLPPPRFAAVGWIETERLNVEPSRPHVCAVIIGRSRGGMVLHPQKTASQIESILMIGGFGAVGRGADDQGRREDQRGAARKRGTSQESTERSWRAMVQASAEGVE